VKLKIQDNRPQQDVLRKLKELHAKKEERDANEANISGFS